MMSCCPPNDQDFQDEDLIVRKGEKRSGQNINIRISNHNMETGNMQLQGPYLSLIILLSCFVIILMSYFLCSISFHFH